MSTGIRVALLAIACTAAAAAAEAPRYTVETLADGVYAVRYNPELEVEGNTLIVVSDDDVFVVDSNAGPTTARATIAEIRKITPKPVRYVVNTHWHDDHALGNQAYADAYPGVQFIAHPLTRQDIVSHAYANNAYVLDIVDADIARLSGYLATGIGRDGKPMTPEYRERVEAALRSRREALADRRALRAVPPSIDVGESLTLERGERRIQIQFLGRGNTRGDLIVYLPRERIVATGDLVVAPVPYATNAYGIEWIRTLDRLMAIPAATILPGHGPVMRDWSYVRTVKDALERTADAVAAAKKEGLSLAQTTERVQLPEVRESFVRGSDARRTGYEAFFRPTLIRSLWEELDPDVMQAYAASAWRQAAEDVYVFGLADGSEGALTAILNQKDVVLVNAPASGPSARAAVRALRELTDRPVRYVIVTSPLARRALGLEVLREVYPQAEMVSGEQAAAGMVVSDLLTLHRGDREIRVRPGVDGALMVEIPSARVRIGASGRVEIDGASRQPMNL